MTKMLTRDQLQEKLYELVGLGGAEVLHPYEHRGAIQRVMDELLTVYEECGAIKNVTT